MNEQLKRAFDKNFDPNQDCDFFGHQIKSDEFYFVSINTDSIAVVQGSDLTSFQLTNAFVARNHTNYLSAAECFVVDSVSRILLRLIAIDSINRDRTNSLRTKEKCRADFGEEIRGIGNLSPIQLQEVLDDRVVRKLALHIMKTLIQSDPLETQDLLATYICVPGGLMGRSLERNPNETYHQHQLRLDSLLAGSLMMSEKYSPPLVQTQEATDHAEPTV